MSTPRPFGDGLCQAVRHYLQQNNKTHLGQINAEILADLAERYYAHHEAQTKARKKRGDATPEEIAIYEAYPRKVGREDALRAIRGALEKSSAETLLHAAQRYAGCVARWPRNFRYTLDGKDVVPYPATWFRAGRYSDAEKEWMPAGMFTRPDDQELDGGGHGGRRVAQYTEPQGWLEEFPDAYIKVWKDIPEDSKKAICDHMNKVRA